MCCRCCLPSQGIHFRALTHKKKSVPQGTLFLRCPAEFRTLPYRCAETPAGVQPYQLVVGIHRTLHAVVEHAVVEQQRPRTRAGECRHLLRIRQADDDRRGAPSRER